MIRFGQFSPEEVLPFAAGPHSDNPPFREYVGNDGNTYSVKMGSQRYRVFAANPTCVMCGITGTVMVLEKDTERTKRLHFNLYAEDNGGLILMTKDHIKPRSKGGKNHISNYQTMCTCCNRLKSNKHWTPEQLLEFRSNVDTFTPYLPFKFAWNVVEQRVLVASGNPLPRPEGSKRKHRSEHRAIEKVEDGSPLWTNTDGRLFRSNKTCQFRSIHNPNDNGKLLCALPKGTEVQPVGVIGGCLFVRCNDHGYFTAQQGILKKDRNDVEL